MRSRAANIAVYNGLAQLSGDEPLGSFRHHVQSCVLCGKRVSSQSCFKKKGLNPKSCRINRMEAEFRNRISRIVAERVYGSSLEDKKRR